MTALLLELLDYTFHLKYQQGVKMFISDGLSRLHIEAEEHTHGVVLLDMLQHLNEAHMYYNSNFCVQVMQTGSKPSSINDQKIQEQMTAKTTNCNQMAATKTLKTTKTPTFEE